MKILHRFDSDERMHFEQNMKTVVNIKPTALYCGYLEPKGMWSENIHSHDFCEIIFVVSGNGTVEIDGKTYELKRGDIAIYNANSSHCEHSSVTSPLESLFFAVGNLSLVGLPPNHLSAGKCVLASGDDFNSICTLMSDMVSQSRKKQSFYSEIVQSMIKTALLLILRRISQSGNEPITSSEIFNKALSYVEMNFARVENVSQIADALFVSKFHLSHLFSKNLKIPLVKHILNLKIKKSKELLKSTTLSLTDICNECGFNSSPYFCRRFKLATGLTPLEYRKS